MPKHNLMWKGLRRTDPDQPRPLSDAVLRLIWEEERLSRADIARLAGLSRSTVSEIIKEILPSGLVKEVGEGPSRGGRRPIVLEFQDDACNILGIEMGGAHVAVALMNLRGKVLAWETVSHPVREDAPGARKLMGDLCRKCLALPEFAGRPLVGLGLAAPSPVDPGDPYRMSSVVLPEWKEDLGLDDLKEELGVPLLVDNDANLGALAELWWGCCHGADNLAYIKVATGIGSGLIINGEIFRGATGVAGEIGHMAIDPHGETCVCGLQGCLVTMAGGAALMERVKELIKDFPESDLASNELNILALENAALSGDPLALKIVNEAAKNLGTAVASLLNLLNPAVVVMGGDLTRLGELLLAPLRRRVRSRTLVSSVSAAKILASELGTQSVSIGAATLVLKSALEDSRLFPELGQTHKSGKKTSK
ncbi:MAG: ROK family transcriptional regulator [bacterium]|nr:ROK family transcriptional regulator [bacterium]